MLPSRDVKDGISRKTTFRISESLSKTGPVETHVTGVVWRLATFSEKQNQANNWFGVPSIQLALVNISDNNPLAWGLPSEWIGKESNRYPALATIPKL